MNKQGPTEQEVAEFRLTIICDAAQEVRHFVQRAEQSLDAGDLEAVRGYLGMIDRFLAMLGDGQSTMN